MTRDHFIGALRVLILVGIVALLWLTLRTAGAQEAAPADRPELVRRLTTICIGEAGWSVETGDCAAIVSLLMRRADRLGLRPRTMAARYSANHFDRERTDGRAWLAHLSLDGARPRRWPARLSWARYQPALLETAEHVRAVLRGDVADPCDGAADHWGAPYGVDLERATRAGWTRLDCGATRNAFWSTRRGRS